VVGEEVAGVDMVAVVGMKEVGMVVAVRGVARASVREERELRERSTRREDMCCSLAEFV
jgi:hypothetical protein